MDFVSHGLWGSLVFGRKNKKVFWKTFLIGIAPDFFSFGPYFLLSLLGLAERSDFSGGPPDPLSIPGWVYQLYNVTHSLVIFAIMFFVVWAVFKKPFLPLLAWGLHILLDIVSHSFEFFPTPFLWPISDLKLDLWMWGNSWVYLLNLIPLALAYLVWFIVRKKASR